MHSGLTANFVMPGLVPGIHVFRSLQFGGKGVDRQDKPGRDGKRCGLHFLSGEGLFVFTPKWL